MNIFKTRYRVQFDDDIWMYVLQYRKWYWPIYRPFLKYAIEGHTPESVIQFIPDDGVIVGQ